MANKRYFEFVAGGSKKFWELTRKAASVTVRFGRIGTEGQSKTKYFRDADAASIEADALIKEKLRKGYVDPTAEVNDSDYIPDDESDDVDEPPETRVRRLPARRPKTLDWDAFARKLGYGQKQKLTAKWEREMRKVTGLACLPPSYVEYQQRLNAVGEWIRSVRGNRLPYYLNIMSGPEALKRTRAVFRDGLKADTAQAQIWQKWQHLLPFGSDASLTTFCWNPAEIDRRGEPVIYEVDRSGYPTKVRRLAGDLLELLQSYKPH